MACRPTTSIMSSILPTAMSSSIGRPTRSAACCAAARSSIASSRARRALAPRSRSRASGSAATSAMVKGETLIDTAMTLNAMHPDVLVVRHPESGAVHLLSEKVDCAVVNAGDGSHEHPTQALLDALTIRRHKGRLGGLTVAICGDVLHSRVARSNIALLNTMGAHVRVVAPLTLLPAEIERLGVEVFHDMAAGLADVDIVMMLRLQSERMHGAFIPTTREYFYFFGLDYDKLRVAKPDALIMHPGPMNRGVEIGSEVADDIDRSLIRSQVEI